MAYKIHYQPHKEYLYPNTKPKNLLKTLRIFLCALFITVLIALGRSDAWFEILDTLAMRVKTGTEVGQAFSQCCTEILEYATYW